jgi:hypothetical protein
MQTAPGNPVQAPASLQRRVHIPQTHASEPQSLSLSHLSSQCVLLSVPPPVVSPAQEPTSQVVETRKKAHSVRANPNLRQTS